MTKRGEDLDTSRKSFFLYRSKYLISRKKYSREYHLFQYRARNKHESKIYEFRYIFFFSNLLMKCYVFLG